MKSAVAAAVLIAVASAQTTLPSCAITCATSSFSVSGCSAITDYHCLCSSTAYISAYANCVATACDAADQAAAAAYGNNLCASAGVTITSTPAITATASNSAQQSSAASSASSGASSVSSSISSAASASSSSASKSASSESSAASSSASSASRSASSAASSASAAASSSASSSSSAGAAPTHALNWEVVGLGAAAVAALL